MLWETVDNSPSGRLRTAYDLHLLAAMAGDLELSETGDLELGPTLAADEVDAQLVDVLRLGGRRFVGRGRG
jgi:hypothetical protein